MDVSFDMGNPHSWHLTRERSLPYSFQIQGYLLDEGPLLCYTAEKIYASSPRTIPISLVDLL